MPLVWTDYGWVDAPLGWAPGDPLPTGATPTSAVNLEAFGEHITAIAGAGIDAEATARTAAISAEAAARTAADDLLGDRVDDLEAAPGGGGGTGYGDDVTVNLDGTIAINLNSRWGINAAGEPYFDTAGAAPGEDALPQVDPTTGATYLIQPEGLTA